MGIKMTYASDPCGARVHTTAITRTWFSRTRCAGCVRTGHSPSPSGNRKMCFSRRSYNPAAGKVWHIQPNGKQALLDSGLNRPSNIALSPDGLWLAVTENNSHWGYRYRVNRDGNVQDKQRFYWFHVPDTPDDRVARAPGSWIAKVGSMRPRAWGQVLDRNGRS